MQNPASPTRLKKRAVHGGSNKTEEESGKGSLPEQKKRIPRGLAKNLYSRVKITAKRKQKDRVCLLDKKEGLGTTARTPTQIKKLENSRDNTR